MKKRSTFHQSRIDEIHTYILNLDPRIELRNSYGIPFLYCLKYMAYLSVQKGVLLLGFVQGVKMDHSHGWFTGLDRKQIRHLAIPDDEPIPYEKITCLIEEAIQLNLKKI